HLIQELSPLKHVEVVEQVGDIQVNQPIGIVKGGEQLADLALSALFKELGVDALVSRVDQRLGDLPGEGVGIFALGSRVKVRRAVKDREVVAVAAGDHPALVEIPVRLGRLA